MKIRWKGGIAAFSVGYKVSIDGWNAEVQRCKKGSWHGKDGNVAAWVMNGRIGEMELLAHSVMEEMEEGASPVEVRARMNLAMGRAEKALKNCANCSENSELASRCYSMKEWLAVFIKERSAEHSWSDGTRKKYDTFDAYITSYAPNVKVSDVDSEWLNKFASWFASIGVRNSTVKNILCMMRWFLKWAEERGVEVNADWKRFRHKLKVVPRKVIFLNWAELMRVLNLKLTDKAMICVRDIFCLQCFTSLRYSDVHGLKHSQVKSDRLEVVTQKTHDLLVIELNKYAKEILDRYKDLPGDYAMPQFTMQRFNQLLKEVGKMAGLDEMVEMVWYVGTRRVNKVCHKWELMTSHCGRRTFICNSLAMGIPAETVMKWTGHSDYKAMRPYIDVADSTKQREMAKWDRWG